MKTEKKLLIVSQSFPPLVVGSPILLANLFNEYKGEVVCAAGWESGTKSEPGFKAPCKTYYLKLPSTFFQRVFDKFAYFLQPLIRLYIYLIIKKEKPDAIFCVFPNSKYFISGFRVARYMKLPFMAHMHDLWEENCSPGSREHKQALKWEKKILTQSDVVFCMTDTQMNWYKEKYGIDSQLLLHTVPSNRLDIDFTFIPKNSIEKRILYTGNISRIMNMDALKEFVKCVDILPENYKVTILCSFDQDKLKKFGLYNPKIEYNWVSRAEADEYQNKADMLFLPLSFKECSIPEVTTVFATKTLDYLTSGTPILVYSRPDSYHSMSARKNGWGYVVDEESPEKLAAAIQKLCNDQDLQNQVVTNAFKEAESRRASVYADRLLQIINQF